MKKLFSLLTLALLTTSAWAVDYVKVGSDADLTNGTYLIVYEDGGLAFNGGLETLDAASNTIAVTIADGKIASDATVDAASFTIDVTAGTILSANGFYIGQTSDANGLKQSTDALTNAISIDADGNAVIVASGKPYLRYNANSGQERFRYFKSSTYSNQKPIALYKLEGSAPVVTVAAPTLPEAQDFEDSFTVTITNNEAGATLYYSTDGLTWNAYEEALVLTETTTVYAKATKNGVDSRTVSATYTKVEPAAGIATLAAANALDDNTDFTFTGDAVVTYHNGKYLFLRDNSGYGLIYYATAPAENIANGAVLSQNWTATKVTYNDLVEYSNPANVAASGVSNSALAAVQEINAADMANMINAYVKINHVKSISGTTATLADGTTIALYNRFTGVTIPEFTDQDCSITGIVSIYKGALQLYFIESDYNSTVTPVEGTTFALVTDVAELNDGDQIILVNNDAAKAMGAARTNNYGAVDVTINSNTITTSEATVITLEAQDNNWALKTADGYLYAVSSSSNHLKAKAELDSNAIAAISIEDAASIIFQGANTRNNLRYNSSSILFSCYASGQQPVHIYKATTEVPPVVTVAAPVFTPESGTKFIGSQTVSLTCETEGANILYAINDGEFQEYTAPFTITETSTIKAKAQKDNATSNEVTAKYYRTYEVSTIAEANALNNNSDFIFYGNAVVTYRNGKYIYVKDETGYGLIFGNQVDAAITEGMTLSEDWTANFYLFSGMPEYRYPSNVTATTDALVEINPIEYTVEQIDSTKMHQRVMLKGVTLTKEGDNLYLNGLQLYNQFGIELPADVEGNTYDLEAMVSYHNALQLYPIAITEAAAPAGLRGDINDDQAVTIDDVTAMIDYLLSGNDTGLNLSNGDCDLNGEIAIDDVTTLIDYLLSGNWANN